MKLIKWGKKEKGIKKGIKKENGKQKRLRFKKKSILVIFVDFYVNVPRVFASHPFQYPFHEADPEPQHCLIVLTV